MTTKDALEKQFDIPTELKKIEKELDERINEIHGCGWNGRVDCTKDSDCQELKSYFRTALTQMIEAEMKEIEKMKNKPFSEWLQAELKALNVHRQKGTPEITEKTIRYIQVDDIRDKKNRDYNRAIDDVRSHLDEMLQTLEKKEV